MNGVDQALAVAFHAHQSGNLADAERGYRNILQAAQKHADARHLLGVLLHQSGQHREAVDELRQAVAIKGDQATFYNHLGAALGALGESDQAEAAFREALRLAPNDAQAYYNLAALDGIRGRAKEAERGYRDAVRLNPRFAEAWFNLGNLMRDQKRLDEAAECFRQALDVNPRYLKAGLSYAAVLHTSDRRDEAVMEYRRLLGAHPDHAEAHFRLGVVLQELSRFEESRASFEQALRVKPEHVEAKFCHGVTFLTQGNFAAGWSGYEWRGYCNNCTPQKFNEPTWDGTPLAGRTLLVHAEQGLGDTFQFIRYLKMLDADGGRVITAVPKTLVPLLRQSGFNNLVSPGDPIQRYDVQIPLLSLPHVFGTTLETTPDFTPYIVADQALVAAWYERFAAFPGYRIGINWQGNPEYLADKYRSFPLQELQPVANLPGVRLISLQKQFGLDQLTTLEGKFAVTDLGDQLDTHTGPFLDTAAVIANLDLVITSDSAVAHLAGAMRVPVWLATSFSPEWRWMVGRSNSPWYPTMRLFRQPRVYDWRSVFNEMAATLQGMLS
jgi:tetratricopeptide (TPR) repeat protein